MTRRSGWLAAVVFLVFDLVVLPGLLWRGPTDYSPIVLLEGIRNDREPARSVMADWVLLHLAAGLALGNWWTRRQGRSRVPGQASQYGSHGSARFASPRDLAPYLRPRGPGLLLGKTGSRSLLLPSDPRLPHNRNVTVLGSSGTGKTRSFVQPNLLQEARYRESSIVCVDPKGENFARSARLLRRAGYEVRLLNFLQMAQSDRWNPLEAVRTTTDAADIAVNLVANTINPNRPRGGDPFWDQAEQSFITALVLYVKQHRPTEEQHMASVLELGAELHPNNLDRIFLALTRESPARRFYRTFLRAEEKVRAGVVAGIGSRLQLWNVPDVVALTSASDLRLADLGQRHIALFLVIPDAKATYTPILALFWQQVFQVLYEVADRHGGALPVPVRCVMDEIANCGYIPDYAQKKSTMRSRRISTEEIWQSLGQLKNRYSSTWGELLANSDHLLFLGANDLETANYISSRTGTTTITVLGTGNTEGSTGGSVSNSTTYLGRPLMTPDECLRMPNHSALLFPKGQFPARMEKLDFTAHPLAKGIELDDLHSYAAPGRSPVMVTDVEGLLASVLPAVDGQGESDRPADDPSQFIDDEVQIGEEDVY